MLHQATCEVHIQCEVTAQPEIQVHSQCEVTSAICCSIEMHAARLCGSSLFALPCGITA